MLLGVAIVPKKFWIAWKGSNWSINNKRLKVNSSRNISIVIVVKKPYNLEGKIVNAFYSAKVITFGITILVRFNSTIFSNWTCFRLMTIFTGCHYVTSYSNSFITILCNLIMEWSSCTIGILNIHQVYPCLSQNLKKNTHQKLANTYYFFKDFFNWWYSLFI